MKSILSMLLAITMVCMHATAQNTVTNINTEDPQACAQYLIQNPLDTIVSYTNLSADSVIVYKVFFKNGVVSQEMLTRLKSVVVNKTADVSREDGDTALVENPKATNDVIASRRINSVKKDGNTVVVVSDVKVQNGSVRQDTATYRATTVKDLSFQEREDYVNGNLAIVNPEHKDLDGNFRHGAYIGLGGGAVFARATSPEASIHLGYETCHYLWELEGIFSSTKYTESADYRGRYITFSGLFNAGWKFWQDNAYHQSLAAMAFVGYGYQKTDGDDAMDRSRNYGLVGGAKLRYTFKVSDWHFWGEAGWKIVPEVQRGEEQNCNAGGLFFSVAVARRF